MEDTPSPVSSQLRYAIYTINRTLHMIKHTTTYVIFLLLLWSSFPLFGQTQQQSDTLKIGKQTLKFEQTLTKENFVLADLIRGKSYLVHLGISDFESCLPIPTMSIPFKIIRESAEDLFIDFVATDTKATIYLKTPCADNPKNAYLADIQCTTCMPENSAARFGPKVQAQAGVDENYLVKEVFVAGGCYDVDNVTYKGGNVGKGEFSNGDVMNMEEGIILSTGNVAQCSGPNNSSKTSTKFNGVKGDTDLRTLLRIGGVSSKAVTDVAILEFDFTPTSDKVTFEYLWASEEYCDYSYSDFNDVFGFFVSGPGINGPFSNNGINIAKIPGSNNFVSINNINWKNNKPLYNNNAPLGQTAGFLGNDCTFGELLAKAVASDELEYDGFTDVLTATVDVIPCETYHIKLAVGDVGDDVFDSAVFLKANSFKLGDPAELATEIPNATFPDSNLVYESCQESFFVFKRTEDSDITKPQRVPFTISDLSTATANVDYSSIRSPVTIPVGKDSIKVPVTIFQDDEIEGPETIIFELESACTCEEILTELVITEPEEPTVTFEDLSTCPGGTINISPTIEGGVGDFTYQWNTTETTETISDVVDEPTTYFVTVTDECGTTASAEVEVKTEDQVATLSGQMTICNGEPTGELAVNFTGGGPYSLEYELDGEPKNISGIPDANFVLPVNEAGTYQAVAMTSNGCTGTGEGTGEVIVTNVNIENKLASPKCNRSTDGFIEITMDEDEGTYQYAWDNGADDKRIENLDEGDYQVTVTNELGCQDTKSFTLTKPERLNAALTPSGISNCYNPKGGSIKLEVEGGTAGYTFDWNNDQGNSQNLDNLEAGIYKVVVTDFNGCKVNASAEIEDNQIQPTAVLQEHGILSCLNDELAITGYGTSEGEDFLYNWTTDDGNIVSQFTPLKVTVNGAGTYKLEITNEENGCKNEVSTIVTENREDPQIELLAPAELNCKEESRQLEGVIMEEMADYDLAWSTEDGNFVSETDILQPEINAAGVYKIFVTNNVNGCSTEKSVTVTENKVMPAVNLLPPDPLTCEQTAISLKTEIGDSGKEYEVSWATIDGNFLENRTTLNPSVDQPGIYTLKVKDPDNFCETEVQTNVLIDTLSPKVNAGATMVFNCDISQLNLNGSVVDNRPYTYNWTTENGNIIAGTNTLNPAIDIAGEYQLIVTDELNGCESMDKVLIEDDTNRPVAEIAAPDAFTCTRNKVVLDAANSTQGTTINYRWETQYGEIIDDTNPINPVMGAAGQYMLFVVDQSNGCEGKKIVEIPLDTVAPTALITAPEVFSCQSETVQIDGSLSSTGSNFAFNWSTEDGNIRSKPDVISPIIDEPGTYEVAILNMENGCISTANLAIITEEPTAVELAIDQPLCHDDRGQANIVNVVGGVGPYTYSIDGGNRFVTESGFGYLDAGFYNLVVKDANDCEIEEVVQIIQPEELAVDLGVELAIKLGDSTQLQALTNIPDAEVAEIIWTPAIGLSCDDCMEPMARPFQSVEYQVEIIDQNGCEANSQVRLLVDQTPQIFVPNVFAPFDSQNGNDRFTIFAKAGIVNEVISLEIYNRWGETVYQIKNFSPNDPSKGWDGFFDNQRMRPAVFVYRAEVEMIDGRTLQLSGDFALVE